MTTSDLVARLTARANLTYSYPIEDILLLRGAADELDRLNAENARLREALENLTRRCREYCFDKCRRDCEPRTECRFYRARAALAKKEST